MAATKRRKSKPVTLAAACAKLLKALEKDLRARVSDEPELAAGLRNEWQGAKDAGRTAKPQSTWIDELLTQVGASWILACVFIRFSEDNGLLESPVLSGRSEGEAGEPSHLNRARDAEQAYYAQHPTHAEAEYLEHVFQDMARLPGMTDLFDQSHAPLWRLRPRSEGARGIVNFFREVDDETGALRWDFTDPERNTRFLGDLYQDLSEAARKNYALLQTPEFVEEFILDRTLEPAIDTFGLEGFRMIDPTCGSGHFLLGAFARLVEHWQNAEPGTELRELVRRSLASVHGVDVNPFAIAIARFRLTIAALVSCGIERLSHAPAFHVPVAVGDSLLHGPRFAELRGRQGDMYEEYDIGHLYGQEVADELKAILGQPFHAVVGNPPYIRPSDKALKNAYRERFGSCYREYQLTVPFLERFVDLALPAEGAQSAGFVGQITSNAFMKREFGKRVIQDYFPRWDLTHVIDTSGAYIPGHGTPTVILLFRNQRPSSPSVRAVLGIRGEPSTPANPATGEVWTAILRQIDQPGSESDFISVSDFGREAFQTHPWSLSGGGAAELKERIESRASVRLKDVVELVGFVAMTRADDLFVGPAGWAARHCADEIQFVEGDRLRDWSMEHPSGALFPYDRETLEPVVIDGASPANRLLWPCRALLKTRREPNGTHEEIGRTWFEWSRFQTERFRKPLSIAFAEVATHNHFVLDRGGKVFKQTAPVIKLPPDATEDDHFELLAILNSSLACFWMQQVFHNKGGPGGGSSKDEKWKDFYQHDSTKLKRVPLVDHSLGPVARECNRLGQSNQREELVALQEELDWQVMAAYGIVGTDLLLSSTISPPGLSTGQRAFEILAARRVKTGELTTRWFELNGATPTVALPPEWSAEYRALVERRITAITEDRSIGLIESMSCKRRFELGDDERDQRARTGGLILEAVEDLYRGPGAAVAPVTVHAVADRLAADAEKWALLSDLNADNPEKQMGELIDEVCVPGLAIDYLKEVGLRKHTEWQQTWALQVAEDPFLERQEAVLDARFGSTPDEQRRARAHVACWKTTDKINKEKGLSDEELALISETRKQWLAVDEDRQAAIGGETPPVPPKFASADFKSATYWRLRGKLNVPKERFISYPHCSPDGDDSLLIGWAGWDYEQRAAALAQILAARKSEGWTGERLTPILLGIDDLIFWLHKWHGDLGDEYQAFLESEAAAAGLTLEEIRDWTPPAPKLKGRRKASS